MKLKGTRNETPRSMFYFGMVERGPRGLAWLQGEEDPAWLQEEEDVGDIASYGIDWEEADDPQLMQHLLENNPHELEDTGATGVGLPPRMNEVVCDAPDAPFSQDLIDRLDEALAEHVNLQSEDMGVRRLVWEEALNICNHFVAHMGQHD